MSAALIALGANQGNCRQTFQAAINGLAQIGDVTAVSSFRDTTPVGGPADQPQFLNAAAILRTADSPQELWRKLHRLEQSLGRVRHEHWGPRTIDLDLLLYDQRELNSAELVIPHPRLAFRQFVLEPAAEIAGDWIYPINGWSLQRLCESARSLPRLISLCGPTASELADRIRSQPVAEGWEVTTAWADDARVIVVLPAAADVIEALDRRRRLVTSPPVLWLAAAPAEHWEWEIAGALAALGRGGWPRPHLT